MCHWCLFMFHFYIKVYDKLSMGIKCCIQRGCASFNWHTLLSYGLLNMQYIVKFSFCILDFDKLLFLRRSSSLHQSDLVE